MSLVSKANGHYKGRVAFILGSITHQLLHNTVLDEPYFITYLEPLQEISLVIMRISEESVLRERSARPGSALRHEKRRNFLREIQFLMPRCVTRLNFDDDVRLMNDDENDVFDDVASDMEESTSDYEVNVSRRFQETILDAISSAASRFAVSPRGNLLNNSRSTKKRSRRLAILCCHEETEDEHSARITDWVLSSSSYEKQTSL